MAASSATGEGKGGELERLTDVELAEAMRFTKRDIQVIEQEIDRPRRNSMTRFKFLQLKARFGHARPKGETEKATTKAPRAYVVVPPDGEQVRRVTVAEDGKLVVELEPAGSAPALVAGTELVGPGSTAKPGAPEAAEAKVGIGESARDNLRPGGKRRRGTR